MSYILRALRALAGRLATKLEGYSMRKEAIESAFSRWEKAKKNDHAAAVTSKKITAALSLDRADVCPYCKGNMRLSSAVGVPVYVCDSDRHVVPAPNDITLD